VKHTPLSSFIHSYFNFRYSTTKLFVVGLLISATTVLAQDAPGRFEIGGSFNALHASAPGSLRPAGGNFGPQLEGDINFGRHLALDAAFSWLPGNSFSSGQVMTGFFGGKVGARTEHFGFFAKVRPGFFTFSNDLRSVTIVGPIELNSGFSILPRFDRLTERALDLGGVMEYYPSRHWAMRWDLGSTVIFGEPGPIVNFVPGPAIIAPPGLPKSQPGVTRGHLQFSTGVHYRF
jgi:hypothetical protein